MPNDKDSHHPAKADERVKREMKKGKKVKKRSQKKSAIFFSFFLHKDGKSRKNFEAIKGKTTLLETFLNTKIRDFVAREDDCEASNSIASFRLISFFFLSLAKAPYNNFISTIFPVPKASKM